MGASNLYGMAAAWGSTNPARTRRIKKSNNSLLQRRGGSAFPSPASQLLWRNSGRPRIEEEVGAVRVTRCPVSLLNCLL
jgi:hypothetical protein